MLGRTYVSRRGFDPVAKSLAGESISPDFRHYGRSLSVDELTHGPERPLERAAHSPRRCKVGARASDHPVPVWVPLPVRCLTHKGAKPRR